MKNLAEHLLWFNYRQFRSVCGLAAEAVSRREALPLGVDLPNLLHHFEQARPSGDAAGFQRRETADRLVRPHQVVNTQQVNNQFFRSVGFPAFLQTPVGKNKNAKRVFFDYPFASDTTALFEVKTAQVSRNRPTWGEKNSTVFYFPHALILKVTVHYVEAETMSWPHPFLSDFVSLSTVFFSPHLLVTVQKYIIVDYEAVV